MMHILRSRSYFLKSLRKSGRPGTKVFFYNTSRRSLAGRETMNIVRWIRWIILLVALVATSAFASEAEAQQLQRTWIRQNGETKNITVIVRNGKDCPSSTPAGVVCMRDYSFTTNIPVTVWWFSETVVASLAASHGTLTLSGGFIRFRREPLNSDFGISHPPDWREFFEFNFQGRANGSEEWLSTPIYSGIGTDPDDSYIYPAPPQRWVCTNSGVTIGTRDCFVTSGPPFRYACHCMSCSELRGLATRFSTGDNVAVFFDGQRWGQVSPNYEAGNQVWGDVSSASGLSYPGAQVEERPLSIGGYSTVVRTCALRIASDSNGGAYPSHFMANLYQSTDVPATLFTEDLWTWVDRPPNTTILGRCGPSSDPFASSAVFSRPEIFCSPP